MSEEKTTANDVCACCRHKGTPRDAREQKNLQNRINRIIGQLKGIQGMIEDNRYCGDVLIQIGAVESALQSLGYVILEEHMQTCVAEGVREGNTQILAEAVELMKKLK
ncbi:MAG: metal-sensing transcriptional repressor [Lachnospiraceae bacterium]|nr:metal-sensing transcriptional repressor [Lachnospiraceae bacterium]